MKFRNAFLLIFSIFSTVFLYNCGSGGSVNPSGPTFNIYVDYWNTTGQTPQISIDWLQTSKEIKIDSSKTFSGQANGLGISQVILDNIRIVDAAKNNYNIEAINVYEYQTSANAYVKDVEFSTTHSTSEDVSLVLVLDRSKSLGSEFANIKQYAKDFVAKMFNEHKTVQIGIVDFSDEVKYLPLTADKTKIFTYIDGLVQGSSTDLYDAMNKGIDMLLEAKTQSRVLFTFTDGYDNLSPPTVTPTTLLAKLRSDPNASKITSFCIGFEGNGGVNQTGMTALATNGGSASFPATNADLKAAFENVGKVISNVYNITYTRNNQIIYKTAPRKIKFELLSVQR